MQVSQYINLAKSAYFGSSVIELKSPSENSGLSFRSRVFSRGNAKTTDATLASFRQAMSEAYGVCGEHAFDSVLGVKMQLHQRLTAGDVMKAVNLVPSAFRLQTQNEFERLLGTSPRTMDDLELQKQCRDEFGKLLDAHLPLLGKGLSHRDVREFAAALFEAVTSGKTSSRTEDADGSVFDRLAEVKDGEPMALLGLDGDEVQFSENETSVEDRIKKGTLGTGMCVNLGKSRPVILKQLKTAGVEPGFIFHNDWSRADTHSMLRDVYAAPPKSAENGSKTHAEYCLAGLKAGRGNPAAQAFAADYLIDRALSQPDSLTSAEGKALVSALRAKFPNLSYADLFQQDGSAATSDQRRLLKEVKTALFVELRAAIMNSKDMPELRQFEAFRHFSERNILKLDYNEGDKTRLSGAGSCGHFRLPERFKGRYSGKTLGGIQGVIRRQIRLKTAVSASVDAVGEALANDLTRLCGVKAQDLVITRGKYSDGSSKLMLTARYAQGYRDLGDGFLKDGRIVPLKNGQGTGGKEPEDLGRFKAIFLLLGDRDTLGSKGGNKGLVNGEFFAIDPGHSLEGTTAEITVNDDLSFTDNANALKKKFVHRFLNFSVFDDSTRSEKFKGILTIRALRESGKAKELFKSYREKFPVGEKDSKDYELNVAIQKRIGEMEREFDTQMDRMLKVFQPQLELYDALSKTSGEATAEMALNTIENLEKSTSPTTSVSKHGEVKLKHLEVIPKTRVPWSAALNSDGTITFTSRQKLSEKALGGLSRLLQNTPFGTVSNGQQTAITVDVNHLGDLFNAISDENIRSID